MPVKSKAQFRFMQMIAHNPERAKELKVPQSVGKEFINATPKDSFKKLKEKVKNAKK